MHLQLEDCKILLGRMAAEGVSRRSDVRSLRDAEFKVFSQFGDDGIIQHLVWRAGIASDERSFVEFGVEDYKESNTRFLLMNDSWRGLVMDGDDRKVASIRRSEYYWRHTLSAIPAFVDRDNINGLLVENGFTGEVGLLSVDLDGNDYWVLEAIQALRPIILVVEYNASFGARRAVTIPYDPLFVRSKAHYSNLYWGASLPAMVSLASRRGYAFVGTNSAGNNAYFVIRARLNGLRELSAEEGYTRASFRESRDQRGRLTYLGLRQRLLLIADMSLWDLEAGRTINVGALLEDSSP